MHALKLTLVICTVAGFWQPPSWTPSTYKHVIYKAYAAFLNGSLYIFALSQFMDIALNVDNSDELVDSMYMMLTVFVAGYKQICLWMNRGNLVRIINALFERPFRPSGSREVTIQQNFEKMVQ